MQTLKNKQILVTGATGFVGSNLVRRLLAEGALVTATGRNGPALTNLERAGARVVRAHLLDIAALRDMIVGQEIVFHVAAWLGPRHGPVEDAWALNVYASGKLARLAAEAAVTRLVQVSSIAAYGPPDRPVMDESRPVDPDQHAIYGRTKAGGELCAGKIAEESDLSLVIARPGIIYGPGSAGWSLRMVQFIRRGVPVIFGGGEGYVHPVYIDNLIDGLILAAVAPAADGQAFNFVDRPVRWQQWFSFYGQMCGRRPRALPMWPARLALRLAERLPLGLSVDRSLMTYYDNRSVYPTGRARRVLGYRPRVDLAQGMVATELWLREEGAL